MNQSGENITVAFKKEEHGIVLESSNIDQNRGENVKMASSICSLFIFIFLQLKEK